MDPFILALIIVGSFILLSLIVGAIFMFVYTNKIANSLFIEQWTRQDENKFKVIYKAADNCHYDLKVTFVIDTNAYKKILNDKFKEGEILNVIVTDIKRI